MSVKTLPETPGEIPDFQIGDIWIMYSHGWERLIFINDISETQFSFWNLTKNIKVTVGLSVWRKTSTHLLYELKCRAPT